MDLTPYLDRLRDDVATSASAGDADTQRAATVLSAALEPALRLTLMTALADMAAEVTEQLRGASVDVRVDGRNVRVVVDDPATGDAAPHDAATDAGADDATNDDAAPRSGSDTRFGLDDITGIAGASGDISRITLRLVEQIKSQAERAAADQGLSLNSFVAQAVQQALHSGGHRQRGPHGRTRRGGPRERRRDACDTDAHTDTTATGGAGADTGTTESPRQRGDTTCTADTRSHLHGWVEG